MEDEGEIEYLDEDEEIVQQYVQNTSTPVQNTVDSIDQDIEEQITPLLVERKPIDSKRKHKSDDDSDYDPTEDLVPVPKKKKKVVRKPVSKDCYTKILLAKDQIEMFKKTLVYPAQSTAKVENKLRKLPGLTIMKKPKFEEIREVVALKKFSRTPGIDKKTFELTQQSVVVPVKKLLRRMETGKKIFNQTQESVVAPEKKLVKGVEIGKKKFEQSQESAVDAEKTSVRKIETDRKKMDIRIPDYEDALCLPVRALKRDQYEVKKLKQWNNLCLEHYTQSDVTLKPEKGSTVKSVRTVILRNVKRRQTDQVETTVFGKTSVESDQGQIKTVTYQSTLPKYREKKVLQNYPLIAGGRRLLKHTFEAVLTMETENNDKSLVVYKPKDSMSTVYKFLDNNNSEDLPSEDRGRARRVLREVASCRVCAPCYQASWRGVNKQASSTKLKCSICNISVPTVYNLITHLNTRHTASEVAAHRVSLSQVCAQVVDYHYRCKVCQEKLNSIKLLRSHVTKHQGYETFKCEVGNHMAS